MGLSIRHGLTHFEIPNEQVQEDAGQRQTGSNDETAGIAFYQHAFSENLLADFRGMVRDNAKDFDSNDESTPIELFQNNSFREGYFRGSITAASGRQEWKFGVESDNTFLHENFHYLITDPSRFEEGTPDHVFIRRGAA